nr:hypothetical protein [Flavobacteriaceae bacterium]
QDGTNLIITESDGNPVTMPLSDLAGTGADTNTTNTSLSQDGTNLIITDSDGNTVTMPLSDLAGTGADTNTTNTSLSQDGTNLIITDSDGNTVTMPLSDLAGTGADTNTTNTTLATTATDLVLTDSDSNTVSVSLADIAAGVDTNTTNASLTQDGTNLILTDSDSNTVSIALADISTSYTAGNLINITGNTISKVNNIQVATVAASMSVDLASIPEGIYRFDMSTTNNITIAGVSNPVDGGVYNFHFVGASNGTVTLPNTFVKEDGTTTVGTLLVPTGQMLTFYYYQGTYYTMEQ